MGKEDEKRFFDATYATNARRPVGKYYSITASREKFYLDQIADGCAGQRVLEYGCGPGSFAFELAKRGAQVAGIDISETAIEQARAKAAKENLQIDFQMMDAENLTFPDGSFDLVCGTGIIHHLNIEKAMAELQRVLTPSGRAVFSEPLGHNPALRLFRHFTPQMRTADEHPLVRRDLSLMGARFQDAELRFFHFCSMLSFPLLRTRLFFPAVKALDGLDTRLFRAMPWLGPLAWYVVITLRNPVPVR